MNGKVAGAKLSQSVYGELMQKASTVDKTVSSYVRELIIKDLSSDKFEKGGSINNLTDKVENTNCLELKNELNDIKAKIYKAYLDADAIYRTTNKLMSVKVNTNDKETIEKWMSVVKDINEYNLKNSTSIKKLLK